MDKRALEKTVIELSRKIGSRAPGSFAELKAAEYLQREFNGMGIEAKIETFKSPSHSAVSSELIIAEKEFISLPVQFSPGGRSAGRLIFLGNDELKIKDGENFSGKIGLLTPRTTLLTRHKLIHLLEKKGLEGLIIVSPYADSILTKIVRTPQLKRMPVVCVAYKTGCNLQRYEGEKIELSVETENRERNESQNVIAKIRGTGKNWLIISSHYDTAPFSPGAIDNTGGVAVLLEVARSLKNSIPRADIYFLAAGSEEYGGLDGTGRGARYFFSKKEKDLEDCLAFIDTDGLGSILGMPQISMGGNKKFRETILNIKTQQNYQLEGKGCVGGDHGVAEQHAVPYVWFSDVLSCPWPYYHTPEDTIEFLDFDKLAVYVNDIKKVVEGLSRIKPVYPFIRDKDRLIRPARYKDTANILEITRLAYEPMSMGKRQQDFFSEKLGGKEWYEYKNREIKEFCKKNIYQVIVAEVKGKVVGYATYGFNEEQGIAHIGNNAVHPDYQGGGIGKSLQEEVRRRMLEEGYRKFTVTTLSHDLPAQKIYEKLGYRKYVEAIHYLKKEIDNGTQEDV